MSNSNSYSTLFSTIFSKSKVFFIVAVVSIAVSAFISSPIFISPKFKSEAVLYPSNLPEYSTESPTEQLLQFLQGNDIRDSIIQKFNLIDHYKIDTTSESYLNSLYREFNANVTIKKTNYESVNINALDTDPILAKEIVAEFIDQVNYKIRSLHSDKAKEVMIIWKDQLTNKKELIDTLEAQIKRYSVKYGLLEYREQSREVTAGYMNMLLKNQKGQPMQKAEEMYNNLTKEGRHFQDLHHQLTLAREDYNTLLVNYDAAVRDVNKKLTYTNLVVYPEVADKKAYPIRWLIVVLSMLGSLMFTFILILFYEKIKQH